MVWADDASVALSLVQTLSMAVRIVISNPPELGNSSAPLHSPLACMVPLKARPPHTHSSVSICSEKQSQCTRRRKGDWCRPSPFCHLTAPTLEYRQASVEEIEQQL